MIPDVPEGPVNFLIPPAGVPKLHNVAVRRIELAHYRVQPRFGVATARRQLEEEAAHPVAQNIGDYSKIPD